MSERTYKCDKCGSKQTARGMRLVRITAKLVRWGSGLAEDFDQHLVSKDDDPVLCEDCVEAFGQLFREFCRAWFLGPLAKELEYDRHEPNPEMGVEDGEGSE